MGLKSFLKNILKKFDKSKALNPGERQNPSEIMGEKIEPKINEDKEKPDPFQRVNIDVSYPIKGTIDFAIEQYISAMQYNYKESNGANISPYDAIISLSSLDNSYEGNNFQNQMAFISKARNGMYSKHMEEYIQKSGKDGKPCFYHYFTKRNRVQADSRIYLNCKQENVALLADKLATELGDSEYYFKFNAAESKARRSEQFVFYVNDKTDPDEFTRIISSIEKIKQTNPNLLEGSENINPFMKQYAGFVGYAPEITDPNFVGLDNRKTKITASYNSLLSNVLNEATLASMQKICATKLDLAEQTQGMKIEDFSGFLVTGATDKVLQNPEYLKEFISDVKQNLTQLSMKNPQLDIKGIPNRKEQLKQIEDNKKSK